MVGIRSFPFGTWPIFRCYVGFSQCVNIYRTYGSHETEASKTMTEPDLHTNISGILKIDLIFLLLPFSIFSGLLILESQLGGFSFRVCHNHLKQPPKNRKNPTSPRDNTCQSLGLIFPCNSVTRFLWWTPFN